MRDWPEEENGEEEGEGRVVESMNEPRRSSTAPRENPSIRAERAVALSGGGRDNFLEAIVEQPEERPNNQNATASERPASEREVQGDPVANRPLDVIPEENPVRNEAGVLEEALRGGSDNQPRRPEEFRVYIDPNGFGSEEDRRISYIPVARGSQGTRTSARDGFGNWSVSGSFRTADVWSRLNPATANGNQTLYRDFEMDRVGSEGPAGDRYGSRQINTVSGMRGDYRPEYGSRHPYSDGEMGPSSNPRGRPVINRPNIQPEPDFEGGRDNERRRATAPRNRFPMRDYEVMEYRRERPDNLAAGDRFAANPARNRPENGGRALVHEEERRWGYGRQVVPPVEIRQPRSILRQPSSPSVHRRMPIDYECYSSDDDRAEDRRRALNRDGRREREAVSQAPEVRRTLRDPVNSGVASRARNQERSEAYRPISQRQMAAPHPERLRRQEEEIPEIRNERVREWLRERQVSDAYPRRRLTFEGERPWDDSTRAVVDQDNVRYRSAYGNSRRDEEERDGWFPGYRRYAEAPETQPYDRRSRWRDDERGPSRFEQNHWTDPYPRNRYGRDPSPNLPTNSAWSQSRKPVPINRWKICFSGDSNTSRGELTIHDFLAQVEMFRESESIPEVEMVRQVIHLLRGPALLWYQTVYTSIYSWSQFVSRLKAKFLPNDYNYALLGEIERRMQGENEPVGLYVSDMERKFRAMPVPVGEAHRVYYIRRNLKKQLKRLIAVADAATVTELEDVCKRAETNGDLEEVAPTPKAVKPWNKRREGRVETVAGNLEDESDCDEEDDYTSVHEAQGTGSHRNRLSNRKPTMVSKGVQSIGGEQRCYNCEGKDHGWRDCKQEKTRNFCYWCGKKDTIATEEHGCPKNGQKGFAASEPLKAQN